MEDWLKKIKKLPRDLRDKILLVIQDVLWGRLENLDIDSIKGYENIYRCRSGKIRIIFRKNERIPHTILDVDYRGNIYKRW